MERPVRHLVRVTSGTLTLVVMLLLIQITLAAPAFAASISISPSSGLAGSSATISGSDFLPLQVQLCWDGQNCTNLGTATPSASGQINVGVTIPSDASPGQHTVSACQVATGCTSTVYDVTDNSTETSSPTTSSTTTTTTPTTTSTTTTIPSTTTTRPRSGTTSSTSPPTTTPVTTSTVQAPPTTAPATAAGTITGPSVTTTTTNNSTTTTDGSSVLAAAAPPPPADGSAPFSLDLSKLRFGTDPDAVTADGEPVPESMGEVPLAASEGSATVSKLRFGSDAAATSGFALPRIGIWLGWLVLVVGSFLVIVGFEEVQRRKEG